MCNLRICVQQLKEFNWAHTTLCFSSTNCGLGFELFEEEVAVKQGGISLLLFLFQAELFLAGLKS